MPALFEYLDYKKYLQDLYKEKKEKRNYFSFRNLATKVNGDSSNLYKVVYGKRHPSKKLVENFITYCKFNSKESDFFRLLILFSKSKSDQESQALFEKILKFKQVKQLKVRSDQYEYYQKWYYTAVFTLLDYFSFSGDFKKLAEQLNPKITPKQARESIELLESLGIIHRDSNGRYLPTNKTLTTGEGWLPLAVKKYQEETINLSLNSLQNLKKTERDISSITVSASSESFEEIKRLTKEYRQSIIKLVQDTKKTNQVFQINIQVFPLSEKGTNV